MIHTPVRPRDRRSESWVNRSSAALTVRRRDTDGLMAGVISPTLLSTMAHEIRGPLTAVALSSELLLHDLEALRPEQVRSLVQRIHRGTLWLQGVIENIVCDAALREGRFELHLEPTDLTDIVREVEDLVQPLIGSRGQELHLIVDSDLPTTMADRNRLGQALVNLIVNASKFSPPAAPVVITVRARSESIRVEVADRGCGFEAESTALFERYFRSEHARHTGVTGNGLGLAIVKAIVDAHGGKVGAENRRGGGARFWFEIPMSQ